MAKGSQVARAFASLCVGCALLVSLAGDGCAQNVIDLKSATFVLSKRWFQLTGDNKEGLFRSYAAVVSQNDGLVDFPNLLVINCRNQKPDQKPVLTLHFPAQYRFDGFAPKAWIPRSEIHIRTDVSTYTFVAELNTNEFFVDLDDQSFGYLREIMKSNRVELKVGPALEDIHLVFGDDKIDRTHRQVIDEFVRRANKTIYNDYDFDEVYRLCLFQKRGSATANHWMVLGTVSCPQCDSSHGATSVNVSIGTRKDGYISSESECQKASDAYQRALSNAALSRQKKISVDLRCIRVADPDVGRGER